MGKESWNEGGSWSGRGRDDDYGEGKKRKFNGGVLGHSFAPSFTPHCVPYRPGTTKDKILITDIKIMV
jgi:hypothetical protein